MAHLEIPLQQIYNDEDIRKAYEKVHDHIRTGRIISRYSINTRDIRSIALSGLDLSWVRKVLDLGCGYGFFIKGLKGLLREDAVITGIDTVEANRKPFLSTLNEIGYEGGFIRGSADLVRDMDQGIYDLVIASYSIYFFPHVLPYVARILRPEGLFIVVTHSRFSLREAVDMIPEVMQSIGLTPPKRLSIKDLFDVFPLEDGEQLLRRFFDVVKKIVFNNTLVFPSKGVDDCIYYLSCKLPLLLKDVIAKHPQKTGEVLQHIEMRVREYAETKGDFRIAKDDGIFQCLRPKLPLPY